jgi:DNA-binding transcriptional regulator YiaG
MGNMLNKEEAHKIIDQLPPDATWDDLMYKIYMRVALEKGLNDSYLGKTKDVKEIRKKYNLSQ